MSDKAIETPFGPLSKGKLSTPIRSDNRAWPELSRDIRSRADWRCQCSGECGQHEEACGAEHDQRHTQPNAHDLPRNKRTRSHPDRTAHISTYYRNNNPLDWRVSNLYAICGWCRRALETHGGQREVRSQDTPSPKRTKPGRKDMDKPEKELV